MEKPTTPLMLLIAGLAITMLGCSEDQRLAEMAQDATERQAEQNQEMARLNQDIAENNRCLIQADAESRKEVLQVQRELIGRDEQGRRELNALQRDTQAGIRQERSSLDRQHEELDDERKEIAQQRNRDPIVAAAVTSLGVVLACLAPIVLAVYLLRTVNRQEPTDAELAELLVQEIASDRSMLFSPVGEGRPCLERDQEPARLPPASEDDQPEPSPT
jgi:hypothetical protein